MIDITQKDKNPKIDKYNVNEVCVEYKENDEIYYLTATEWKNGEGWTIQIEGKGVDKLFQLHYNEFSALNLAIETLNLGT